MTKLIYETINTIRLFSPSAEKLLIVFAFSHSLFLLRIVDIRKVPNIHPGNK